MRASLNICLLLCTDHFIVSASTKCALSLVPEWMNGLQIAVQKPSRANGGTLPSSATNVHIIGPQGLRLTVAIYLLPPKFWTMNKPSVVIRFGLAHVHSFITTVAI
jgi:hypothetical protein